MQNKSFVLSIRFLQSFTHILLWGFKSLHRLRI